MSGIKVRCKFDPGVATREIVKDASKYMFKRVKFRTAVVTGRLKRGWRRDQTPRTFIIRNRVKYASYVNEKPGRDPKKGLMISRSYMDTKRYLAKKYGKEVADGFKIAYFG